MPASNTMGVRAHNYEVSAHPTVDFTMTTKKNILHLPQNKVKKKVMLITNPREQNKLERLSQSMFYYVFYREC
jgi:hypothetical protein